MPPEEGVLFDIPFREANLYLQSGVPGFEYKRSDVAPTVRFVGGLRTFKDPSRASSSPEWLARLDGRRKAILVSQGTFEPDHSKLIHPTLEAFRDTDYLVLVATGFHHTETLRAEYQQQNIIIEDFMLGKVGSLNVSVAAGVVLYEVVRQRRSRAPAKQTEKT